ncbi:hypothetical protein EZS27_012829 [termite gut metagenome]|uniref:Uncharacterized protein n=1 Tax=termite gut metagenome TaxID=433724 RepID=A0A5J4RZD9_9ZZZZ
MDAGTNIGYKYDSQIFAAIFALGCIHLLPAWVNRATFVALVSNITHITAEMFIFTVVMDEYEGHIEYADVPDEFRAVQQSLDGFVRVNYDTARAMAVTMRTTPADIAHYRGKIVDIIRNNPPLASVPKYFHDGREDYLWYSDFYDDVTKEVYHNYRTFHKSAREITAANYTGELAKIDLPYFNELVNLVSLERLLMDYKESVPKAAKEIIQPKEELPGENIPATEKTAVEVIEPKPKTKRVSGKRSYEPKLTDKQYSMLATCIETIKLFRRPVSVANLKKLLKGKLPEPLQVNNQKSLVFLLEQLKEHGYIKDAWITVADGNKDFISFRTEGNKQRYGDEEHPIPMQQLLNNRRKSKKEAVHGLIIIEETVEEMDMYRDK